MKRTIRPFTVEHKRRSRAAEAKPASIWAGSVGQELQERIQEFAETDEPASRTDGGDQGSFQSLENVSPRRPGILPARDGTQASDIALAADEPQAAVAMTIALVVNSFDNRRAAASPPPESGRSSADRVPEVQVPEIGDEDPVLDLPSRTSANELDASDRRAYHQRRKAQTKGLALEDRWKWDL